MRAFWGHTKALLTECKNGNLKMLTFKVGACATPASGTAMAEYYLSATLKADPAVAAAAYYYAGAEAEQHSTAASHGATRHIADGGTVALLRRDISPELAARLGIAAPDRPLTQDQIANLLNARRLDGNAIEARKKHSATRSVAEVFGLDPRDPPTAEAIRNVLAGKRADGGLPQSTSGSALPSAIVEGARKRFKAALDIPAHREATTEELAHLANGALATGRFIDMADYRRQIHATRPPVGFVDLTFSADKSLSVAWALAPTEPERAALLDIHQRAVADAMSYAETKLGFARKGQGGADGLEPGALGWISFQHYTARPAVDIERHDKEGRAYTDIREVPLQTADPQLHTHVTVFNSVLTESGRVGAIDLDLLAGRVKELGAVYQAYVAAGARRLGIETVLDETHRGCAARRCSAIRAQAIQQTGRGSRANGARVRRRQRRQLGCHHRRAKGRAPEGRRRGNAAGQRDGDRRRTEKRFRGVARASGGRILPAPQRTAPRCDRASTGGRTAA